MKILIQQQPTISKNILWQSRKPGRTFLLNISPEIKNRRPDIDHREKTTQLHKGLSNNKILDPCVDYSQ